MDKTDLKTEIALDLHKTGALKFGEFTLKSGVVSPMYMDLRLFVSYPDTLKKVAKALSQIISPLKFDRLAGVAYGALPIAAAISLEMNEPWIYMRKEGLAKGYGLRKAIEGKYNKGDVVVVIDDLVFRGDSKLEVIEPFENAGLKINDFVVLIDYEQGAAKTLREKGKNLHSLLKMKEVIDIMKRHKKIDESEYKTCVEFLSRKPA